MARILVISFSDLQRDPRVRRQIKALRQEHTITAAGLGDPKITGVGFVACALPPRTLARKIMEAAELALHQYEQYYWSLPHVIELQAKLVDVDFELIVANDVDTLPVALRVAGTRPVVIDAHEYSPREFEDKLVWRLTRQGFAQHLCSRELRSGTDSGAQRSALASPFPQDYAWGHFAHDSPRRCRAVARDRDNDRGDAACRRALSSRPDAGAAILAVSGETFRACPEGSANPGHPAGCDS